VIGEITNAPAIIDIAINAAGEMYGVDIINDNLIQIDPATGAGTVIGSIGFSANYAQGMDFEEESGVLYLAAYSSQGELRIADPATGNTVLVGAFPGGAETDSLAFATGGGIVDIPWLSEDPTEGTVAADSFADVAVTFDATGLAEGDYVGSLRVKTGDPNNATVVVPVTLHVVAATLPDASFSSASHVLVNTPIVFTFDGDSGIPPADEYNWDFGDGTTVTLPGPDPVVHVYTTVDTFTVTLEVCNTEGCDTFMADVVVDPVQFFLPLMHKN